MVKGDDRGSILFILISILEKEILVLYPLDSPSSLFYIFWGERISTIRRMKELYILMDRWSVCIERLCAI